MGLHLIRGPEQGGVIGGSHIGGFTGAGCYRRVVFIDVGLPEDGILGAVAVTDADRDGRGGQSLLGGVNRTVGTDHPLLVGVGAGGHTAGSGIDPGFHGYSAAQRCRGAGVAVAPQIDRCVIGREVIGFGSRIADQRFEYTLVQEAAHEQHEHD